MKPLPNTYPDYYNSYIRKVKSDDLLKAFDNTIYKSTDVFNLLNESIADYAYAEGKWTIKQLLIHITDTDRIFSYRALRFARGDEQQALPFDENLYAENCYPGNRTLASVIEEYKAVNYATYLLFKSFSEEQLNKTGHTAIGSTTVKAIGFVICGHALHHIDVLKERYLKK